MVDNKLTYATLDLWEERFKDNFWQLAIAIRDEIVRRQLGGPVGLPEWQEGDDDGGTVSFRWDEPGGALGGPDFTWIDIGLLSGQLHEDADGFALRVRAQVDGGRELFNYTADNYTSTVWKTSYQDIQDIIDDLFNVVGDIVEQIRSNAYRWEG